MKLKELKNKKIIILGLGIEGKEVLNFLRKLFPKKELSIADKLELNKLDPDIQEIIKKDSKIKKHLGKDCLKSLKDYDVIIKSPGIPLRKIKPFLKENQIITSRTKIFFDNCKGIIIGVTGTKGKSTTTALIHKVLKDNNQKAYLLGNIGDKPVLSFLHQNKKDNIYVFELSCHQLTDLEKSPQVAILLNIYPEHLDYYDSFKDYVKAKARITKFQNKKDFLIYNSNSEEIKKITKKSKAKKIKINSIKLKEKIKKTIHPLSIKAAIIVGELFKITKEKIVKSIKNFKPLPHRLEKVGAYQGITFYNDSLSTIPEATIMALDKLENKVETILLGGFDRGLDFQKLTKRINKSKIKNIIFFPRTGKKIWKELRKTKKADNYKVFFVDNMKDAVQIAFKETNKGKICLLSNASPSFGIFKNYKERGNLFKKYVKKYGKK